MNRHEPTWASRVLAKLWSQGMSIDWAKNQPYSYPLSYKSTGMQWILFGEELPEWEWYSLDGDLKTAYWTLLLVWLTEKAQK